MIFRHEPDIAAYWSRRVAFLDGLIVADRPQAPMSAAQALATWQDDRTASLAPTGLKDFR
jgi:hypothetical protein